MLAMVHLSATDLVGARAMDRQFRQRLRRPGVPVESLDAAITHHSVCPLEHVQQNLGVDCIAGVELQ